MLKKLKKKFILINMLFVSIILLVVFLAIGIFSYRTELMSIYNGLDKASNHLFGASPEMQNIPSPDGGFFRDQMPPFDTITVFLDNNGDIVKTYTGTEQSAPTEIMYEVLESIDSEQKQGILHKYSLVYSLSHMPKNTVISFASFETAIANVQSIATIFGIAFICCLLLFFGLSYLMASIAIKPAERAWEGQKQFIADASHDLKTPLTVILANGEIVLSHKDSMVTDMEKWMLSTRDEAERMRRLTDSLLELAKTDDMNEPPELSVTNISEICESTVLQMEPVAFEKNVTIESNIEPNINAKSNSDILTRLLHILIDNGIKYSSQGAAVRVNLSQDKRGISISVTNSGSLIQKEDIPHIFERFYRTDKARVNGGFGLGLAIAKNLCASLGAQISAESNEQIGTRFTVRF